MQLKESTKQNTPNAIVSHKAGIKQGQGPLYMRTKATRKL